MVEPHAVLEVSDGVLDLGVAAMVGFQFQGVAIPISDAGVIAVGGEQGQLRAGRGLHPPDASHARRGASPGIFPRVGPGKTSSAAPWLDCAPCRSLPDRGAGNRPTTTNAHPPVSQSSTLRKI